MERRPEWIFITNIHKWAHCLLLGECKQNSNDNHVTCVSAAVTQKERNMLTGLGKKGINWHSYFRNNQTPWKSCNPISLLQIRKQSLIKMNWFILISKMGATEFKGYLREKM